MIGDLAVIFGIAWLIGRWSVRRDPAAPSFGPKSHIR